MCIQMERKELAKIFIIFFKLKYRDPWVDHFQNRRRVLNRLLILNYMYFSRRINILYLLHRC